MKRRIEKWLKYREIYDNAEGGTWQEKLNSMRRDNYAANREEINAQKREAYAVSKRASEGAATTEAIGPSEKSVIDYVDARNFAGDNVRLQNMLRSQDAQQISDVVDTVLNESYNLPESVWNGKVDTVPDGSLGRNVIGKAQWNRTVAICDSGKNDLSVHIHEHLHMRSVNRYGESVGKKLYELHRGIEEGTVELLTQEICKDKNVTSGSRYPQYVEQLKYIRKVVLPNDDDFDFAMRLIDMPVETRYTYLEQLIAEYKKTPGKKRDVVIKQLDKSLEELRR